MNFIFVSLFPELIKGYFSNSILKRAVDKKIINLFFYNPRDFTNNKFKKVDRALISGGAGQLIQIEPLKNTIEEIKKNFNDLKIIFLTPVGKKYKQIDAKRLSKCKNLVLICGRYEGIDERFIEEFVDEVLCIGDFILSGGELASLVLVDSISRNIDEVLGNKDSLLEESFEDSLLEAPNFAKPVEFDGLSVPSDFLKGNFSKIQALKNNMAYSKTKFFRPDLFKKIKN